LQGLRVHPGERHMSHKTEDHQDAQGNENPTPQVG